MSKKSSKKSKKNEFNEEEEFISNEISSLKALKFLKIRKIAYSISILTIIIYIMLKIIFRNNYIFEIIISYFCFYLWILPILFLQMRIYKFSLHLRSEEKIGKIYTSYMVFSLMIWFYCLLAFIFNPVSHSFWISIVIEITIFCGLIPIIILILIFQ